MRLSDGRIIPGNRTLDDAGTADRIARYHAPYHDAIAAKIGRARAHGIVPILVSVHSFTPLWRGAKRPWQLGILWDRDPRLAKALLTRLALEPGLVTGDNEPYSGALENDCLYRHGTMNGLPHVLIEIRQDLIADDAGADAWAGRLEIILADAFEAMGEPHIMFTRASGRPQE
jgi:predicted N-formylglutamate amidohydrolase